MDLSDDTLVPDFVFESALVHLNEDMEKNFFEKLLFLLNQQRQREIEHTHSINTDRKVAYKIGYDNFMRDPVSTVSRDSFAQSVIALLKCFYLANLPCSHRKLTTMV